MGDFKEWEDPSNGRDDFKMGGGGGGDTPLQTMKIAKTRQLTIQIFMSYLIYLGIRKVFCNSTFSNFMTSSNA